MCVCVCVCVCVIEGEIILLVQSNGISHLLYPQLVNLQLRHRLNHRLEIYVRERERERERNREILNSEQSEVHMIGQYLAETTNLWSISGHRYTTKQLGILLALRTEAAVATLISPRYHLEGEIKERESEAESNKSHDAIKSSDLGKFAGFKTYCDSLLYPSFLSLSSSSLSSPDASNPASGSCIGVRSSVDIVLQNAACKA